MLTTCHSAPRKISTQRWIGPAPWITSPPPGPNALQAIVRSRRVTTTNSCPYPLVVRRAQGTVVEDVDGNRFLDFTAGAAGCSTGHCHGYVVQAVEKQARNLIHMSGSDFYCKPMICLAEKLAEIVPGPEAKHVLFTHSGVEAAEAAMKLARDHAGRKTIVAFDGMPGYAVRSGRSSATRYACQPRRFGSFTPGVHHLPYGNVRAFYNYLLKEIHAPNEVAAVIVEPLQVEGGCIVGPSTFLPGLRALCEEHGILLVIDETRTGMGRTGRLFACEHAGVAPDILLIANGLASGMPLGAVVARKSIMSRLDRVHRSTFGGDPGACAAALTTLDLLEKQFIHNTADLEPVAMAKLDEITHQHKCIVSPRGQGLILAVDVVKSRRSCEPDEYLRDRIVAEAFNRGLLLLGSGKSAIHFEPPLCINRVQLEVGLDVFEEAVATVAP